MGGNMKSILIVDDEEDIRLLYKKELEARGYKVSTAASMAEAREIFSFKSLDAVVLDIELATDKNGIDALRWMRTVDKSIPIIINSAFPHYKQDFTTWLADEYLIKTGDLDELAGAIERLTQRKADAKQKGS